MIEEQYYFDISEEGQTGLDTLDVIFNKTTKSFLQDAGLKKGMKVLDIGCGLGRMTQYLAEQVGSEGMVLAIDNNENQVKASQKLLSTAGISNIKVICHSAYDVEKLKEKFDFVYCRFVLHHLIRPTDVIQAIYHVLAEGGVYAAEEGLVSQAFTYPFSSAWGSERWHNDPKDHETEGKIRDGNFGMKLFHIMSLMNFKNLKVNLVQPVMMKKAEKSLLLNGINEAKRSFIEAGNTEAEWQQHVNKMQELVEDDTVMIGFYQSCQVSGVR